MLRSRIQALRIWYKTVSNTVDKIQKEPSWQFFSTPRAPSARPCLTYLQHRHFPSLVRGILCYFAQRLSHANENVRRKLVTRSVGQNVRSEAILEQRRIFSSTGRATPLPRSSSSRGALLRIDASSGTVGTIDSRALGELAAERLFL